MAFAFAFWFGSWWAWDGTSYDQCMGGATFGILSPLIGLASLVFEAFAGTMKYIRLAIITVCDLFGFCSCLSCS